MIMPPPREFAQFRRVPVMGGMSALIAHYRDHTFAPHFHDTFVIGVFDAGESLVRCEQECHRLGPDDVLIIDPGAIHSAGPGARDGRTYRGIYPSAEMVREMLSPQPPGPVRFGRVSVRNRSLAHDIRARMIRLWAEESELGAEEELLHITRLLWKHAGGSPRLADVPMPSARELERVRSLMDAHSSTTLSLRELAAEVGMNRFQLIRAFARRYGVTPYAYFLDRRVERARRLVATGRQLAAVAAECGFADQSHLTRHFKRIVGVTPGEYAAAVGRPVVSDAARSGPRVNELHGGRIAARSGDPGS